MIYRALCEIHTIAVTFAILQRYLKYIRVSTGHYRDIFVTQAHPPLSLAAFASTRDGYRRKWNYLPRLTGNRRPSGHEIILATPERRMHSRCVNVSRTVKCDRRRFALFEWMAFPRRRVHFTLGISRSSRTPRTRVAHYNKMPKSEVTVNSRHVTLESVSP